MSWPDRVAEPDRAEGLRRILAPVVAVLASSMGLCCLLSILRILRSRDALVAIDDRFVGWIGLGAVGCLGVAAAAVLGSNRIGSGPPLALGAMAAVFGLTLGDVLSTSGELTVAIVTCCIAAGALLGGVVGMAGDLPGGWMRVTTLAWSLPFVAAWPLLVRAGGAVEANQAAAVVVPIPLWASATATVVIVGWSILAMLIEPVREAVATTVRWERPWALLLVAGAAALLLTTVFGFATQASLVWLRPVVIVAVVAIIGLWGLALVALEGASARLAFVGATAVMFLVPATVAFAISDASSPEGRLSWLVVGLLSLAAVLGGLAAARATAARVAVVPTGLLLCSVAGVAVWVASDGTVVIRVALAVLLAGTGAVFVGAQQSTASQTEVGRFVGLAAVFSLVLGTIVAIPLSWAMLGDVPTATADMWASGRLYAGLTVAATSLAAAYTWNLRGRIRAAPRPRMSGDETWSAAPEHGAAVDLQDLAGRETRQR